MMLPPNSTDKSRRLSMWGLWFWLSLGCGLKTATADMLYFAKDSPPLAGRLIEEKAESVTFQVRMPDGSTKVETIPHTEVARIIRTINLETLANSHNGSNADILAYAETLLAIHQDLEAQHSGQELLTELLKRDALDDEWKHAICRLKLHAMPPGLARERLRRRWIASGWYMESPADEKDATDSWQWFAARLSPDTKREWLRAIRSDRAAFVADLSTQISVPREELQRNIRQTQTMLVVGDPIHRWTTELLADLTSNDLSALVTIARLEVILPEFVD
ncbi:MAG: hypothetical protein Q8M16_05405 [Pirellulaceae bacterium]|nr:hypothetical protein [Pirellulaceae bacterium]